jgi:uncharacterized protein YndB with AHSA1/START domain
MASDSDQIEKKILLRATRARVWRALTDSKEFGSWFGMRFDAPFAAGAIMRGTLVPTAVDDEIGSLQRPYEGRTVEFTIDRIEPERLFSFRWHPFAIELGVDYSKEATTLIVFELEEAPKGGVVLTVRESGFDHIPLERRAKAFASNDGGWAMQMKLVEKFLAQST